ncbi:MAG: hypothetical protein CVU60_12345 [Deltaproteobacteria bacterium HGW-Deltaproteobacteria-18]|nr:MAG: hypothetical protein CVU60_12345 [Deltaproteobacteria bacterium HGW-Deltaproteobacteria-18]
MINPNLNTNLNMNTVGCHHLLTKRIDDAKDTLTVLISGPRQAGTSDRRAGDALSDSFPRLVRVLAEMSGQMCNSSQLGGQFGLDHKTTARYVGILEQMFLLTRVEAWSRNRIGGLVKTPKLHFLDSGLLSTLLGLTPSTGLPGRNRFGHVLESFVHSELLKHASTADNEYRMFHYRDRAKYEVDLVIENAQGQLVGVEVKAAASVNERDLQGMRRFAEAAGDKMRLGVILYDGAETFSLGPDLLAAPLSTLWGR